MTNTPQCQFDIFYNTIANFSRNFNNQHLAEFGPLQICYTLLDQLRSSYDSIIEVTEMVPRVSYLMTFLIRVKWGKKGGKKQFK